MPLSLRSLPNSPGKVCNLSVPVITYLYVYYCVYHVVLESLVTFSNPWAPCAHTAYLPDDVSWAPSPVPGTLQLLHIAECLRDTGWTRPSKTAVPQSHKAYSLLKLERPENACPSQQSAISENHSFLLSLIYCGTLHPNRRGGDAGSIRERACRAVEGIAHHPLKTRFYIQSQERAGGCWSIKQLMGLFREPLVLWRWWKFPYKVMSLTSGCKFTPKLEKATWKSYKRKAVKKKFPFIKWWVLIQSSQVYLQGIFNYMKKFSSTMLM